jgi:hypothetical protein
VPRSQEHAPMEMIRHLGRLMGAVHLMPLIVCVDQLEDMTDQKEAPERFRQVMHTIVTVTEEVPTSLAVIACLEDYYIIHRQHLSKPKLDRLEIDPKPQRLTGQRTLEEVEAIVGRRLRYFFDDMGVKPDEAGGTSPFTRDHLKALVNFRTRDVLAWCHEHREHCIEAGTWIEPNKLPTPTPPPPPPPLVLEQAWNDFQVTHKTAIPEEEGEMAQLLAWAVRQCSDELPTGYHFGTEVQGRMVPVDIHGADNAVDRLLVAVCEKSAKGGGLGKQVAEVEKQAGEIPAVVVRSTAFPSSPTAQVSKQIGKLIQRGGRRVVVENADWRKIAAFQAFHAANAKDPTFVSWLREGRPLCQLPSLRQILALDSLVKARPSAPAPPKTPAPIPTPTASPKIVPIATSMELPMLLGTKLGALGGEVTITPQQLTTHAAFLGSTKSGKTTAALNLLEQLLERGIPAVLLDRKGDLCRYADPTAWQTPLTDPEQVARRERLRQRLDVAVYTPGEPGGRPLAIPLVPDGADQLSTMDREQIAGYAASALGGMMRLKPGSVELAILRKAIEVLARLPHRITAEKLRQLVADQDDSLLAEIGEGFDAKYYAKLAKELLAMSIHYQRLLASGAEQLDFDALLGRGRHTQPGKVRLSVISTQFVGEDSAIEFWVTQFLIAVDRWRGKNPQNSLQAVLLLDEADRYLPATRQPATKQPLENLLKRARSAGIGLMLATQSPGDLDYKCRDNIGTWLVGKVKEPTALGKLKPMFGSVDPAARLPSQTTGQFHLVRDGEVQAVKSRPSLIGTEQLPEDYIVGLARNSLPGSVGLEKP